MSDVRADLVALLAETHDDPAAFAKLVLHVELRQWQAKVFEEIRLRLAAGERHLRVLVRSCHGAGKTTSAVILACWWTATRPMSRGISTAPTWAAVEGVFWVELAKLFNGSLLARAGVGRLLTTELVFAPSWDLVGLSTDHSVNLEGRHGAAACRIVDECKAVEADVIESTEALLDAAETLDVFISTPSIPSGVFFDRDMKGGDDVIRAIVTINDLVAENLPGKREWREARRREWGENSPIYRSRAMAEYIDDAEGALYPFSWIARAESAAFDVNLVPVCGVDIAGSVAGDASALAIVSGPDDEQRFRVHSVTSWRERDTATTRGKALGLARMAGCEVVAVDYVGIGQGVGDAMRGEKGIAIVPFRASDKAEQPDRFMNRKAEVAWFLRLALEAGRVRLPRHDGLRRELLGMKYQYTITGKVRVVDPPDSPDHVDAILIGLSVAAGGPPTTMAMVGFGSSDTSGWSDGSGGVAWGNASTARRPDPWA